MESIPSMVEKVFHGKCSIHGWTNFPWKVFYPWLKKVSMESVPSMVEKVFMGSIPSLFEIFSMESVPSMVENVSMESVPSMVGKVNLVILAAALVSPSHVQ